MSEQTKPSFSIMERLLALHPNIGEDWMVFYAVHELTEPTDIIDFTLEYIERARIGLGPEKDFQEVLRLVKSNLGLALGELTQEERAVWQETLGGLDLLPGIAGVVANSPNSSLITYESFEDLKDKLRNALEGKGFTRRAD